MKRHYAHGQPVNSRMRYARPIFLSLLSVALLIGAGCVGVTSLSPEEATASIKGQPGMRLTVSESALGVGGVLLEAFGNASRRELTLTAFQPNVRAALQWEKTAKRETDASVKARAEFAKLPPTPVGKEAPKEPAPQYEDVKSSGTAVTDSLAAGAGLLLPAGWPDGGQASQTGRTLLWLSKKQYEELANTRKTSINLGLFDDSIARAYEGVQALNGLVKQLSAIIPGATNAVPTSQAALPDDVTTFTAMEQFGTFDIVLNGEALRVRTIEANGTLGGISVLANPEFPLVLQVRLSPVAYGPNKLLSPASLLQEGFGYQVVEIRSSEVEP